MDSNEQADMYKNLNKANSSLFNSAMSASDRFLQSFKELSKYQGSKNPLVKIYTEAMRSLKALHKEQNRLFDTLERGLSKYSRTFDNKVRKPWERFNKDQSSFIRKNTEESAKAFEKYTKRTLKVQEDSNRRNARDIETRTRYVGSTIMDFFKGQWNMLGGEMMTFFKFHVAGSIRESITSGLKAAFEFRSGMAKIVGKDITNLFLPSKEMVSDIVTALDFRVNVRTVQESLIKSLERGLRGSDLSDHVVKIQAGWDTLGLSHSTQARLVDYVHSQRFGGSEFMESVSDMAFRAQQRLSRVTPEIRDMATEAALLNVEEYAKDAKDGLERLRKMYSVIGTVSEVYGPSSSSIIKNYLSLVKDVGAKDWTQLTESYRGLFGSIGSYQEFQAGVEQGDYRRVFTVLQDGLIRLYSQTSQQQFKVLLNQLNLGDYYLPIVNAMKEVSGDIPKFRKTYQTHYNKAFNMLSDFDGAFFEFVLSQQKSWLGRTKEKLKNWGVFGKGVDILVKTGIEDFDDLATVSILGLMAGRGVGRVLSRGIGSLVGKWGKGGSMIGGALTRLGATPVYIVGADPSVGFSGLGSSLVTGQGEASSGGLIGLFKHLSKAHPQVTMFLGSIGLAATSLYQLDKSVTKYNDNIKAALGDKSLEKAAKQVLTGEIALKAIGGAIGAYFGGPLGATVGVWVSDWIMMFFKEILSIDLAKAVGERLLKMWDYVVGDATREISPQMVANRMHKSVKPRRHRYGLDNVPFDDYSAQLHKGEMVLKESQANMIRNMFGPGVGTGVSPEFQEAMSFWKAAKSIGSAVMGGARGASSFIGNLVSGRGGSKALPPMKNMAQKFEAFAQKYAGPLKQLYETWGIHPITAMVLAQKEQGMGYAPGNNLFGIKSWKGWKGKSFNTTDRTYRLQGKPSKITNVWFDSIEEGIVGLGRWFDGQGRYKHLKNASSGYQQLLWLGRTGYNPNPGYGPSLLDIYHRANGARWESLAEFDKLLTKRAPSEEIKSYDKGTPYVDKDQLALIHKGERIIPAELNSAMSQYSMVAGAIENMRSPDVVDAIKWLSMRLENKVSEVVEEQKRLALALTGNVLTENEAVIKF